MSGAVVLAVGAFAAGWLLWTLAEYLLHRFAMHELSGKGIMSREHLLHHVHASWYFNHLSLLSWVGMLLAGTALWLPLGWLAAGPLTGVAAVAGWVVGYSFYEYHHACAHLRAPTGRYTAWLRRHHFHHHFGHPMANHGVTVPWWDRVFGTLEVPAAVRVPRRLAMRWLLDADGGLRPPYRDDYELVGRDGHDERRAQLDRARAFASQAPAD